MRPPASVLSPYFNTHNGFPLGGLPAAEGAERSQYAQLLSLKAKPEDLLKLRAALMAYMGGFPPDGNLGELPAALCGAAYRVLANRQTRFLRPQPT